MCLRLSHIVSMGLSDHRHIQTAAGRRGRLPPSIYYIYVYDFVTIALHPSTHGYISVLKDAGMLHPWYLCVSIQQIPALYVFRWYLDGLLPSDLCQVRSGIPLRYHHIS